MPVFYRFVARQEGQRQPGGLFRARLIGGSRGNSWVGGGRAGNAQPAAFIIRDVLAVLNAPNREWWAFAVPRLSRDDVRLVRREHHGLEGGVLKYPVH